MFFSIALLFIGVACYSQFEYLFFEFWRATTRFSKGPIIWLVATAAIYQELARSDFKATTTNVDIRWILAFISILAISLYFEPLITPTVLVIFAWRMVSAKLDFSRMMIVWLFLLLSLPTFYSQWVPGLQSLTVVVVEGLLHLVGLPVLVQEYHIAIPRGQFVIAEGCSGERYLTSNLLLLFFYSLLNRYRIYQFLLGLLVTVFLALLMNWIRVVIVILFGHFFGIEHSLVQAHENPGWVLYGLQLVPLFYLLLKIERLDWKQPLAYQPVTRDILAIPPLIFVVPPLLLLLLISVF